MKVYVMTDLEGISGIYSREQVALAGGRFAEGRRYITEDINACVAGLKAAGAEAVYVHDCHGGGYSLEWERVSPEADGYVCGDAGDIRYAGLAACDAVVLLGYHAMAGTAGAILEHTYSSASVQNMYINDVKVGEIAVDAAIAGEQGKPVIMVSGDDKACAEACAFLPGVVTAQVKQGLSCQGGILLPPEKAHQLLYDKAMEAVRNAGRMKPFTFAAPVTCKMEMMERVQLPRTSAKPYMQLIDGRSYTVTADTVEQALFRAFN